jgi:ketosteroid isomerase-like protein
MTHTTCDATIALIRELEDQRYAAMLTSDLDGLNRLLSDRLVYSHSNAERDSKASYLDRVRDGTFVYESIQHPEEKIILADGAAVVIGTMIAKAYWSGELKTLRNGACAVWAKEEDGQWRLIAYQPTPILTS